MDGGAEAGASGSSDGGMRADGAAADGGGGDVVPPAPAVPVTTAPALPPPKPIAEGRGRLEGTVVDAKSGEALIEAQVTVVQIKKRVLTDIDGHYEVSVPPGVYDVRVFAELHTARRFGGVRVDKGRTARLDAALTTQSEEKIAVQEVVVVAKPDTATEAVQLVRRQKAATVSDAISAEQIARSPDTNASEAVKRVVGATIQDGKYVIIRGLGGRYSVALLNGVAIPSPDPDLPAAPLDIFPAVLLANLTLAKTSTPDLPGNFAGGALIIETRDFPGQFTLKLSLTTSGDSESLFRKVNTYQGGSLDFLGYDDGTRALPSAVPRDRPATAAQFPPEDLARFGRSFSNRWGLWSHRVFPNLGLGATVGDTVSLGGRRLGYLASASYGHRWNRLRSHTQAVPAAGQAVSDLQLDSDVGTEIASLGALVNLGFQLSAVHRLGLIALYTHNAEDSATVISGVDENLTTFRRLRFRFLERQLEFNQLTGEHAFGGGRLILDWQGHVAFASQDAPDTRDLYRNRGTDGIYRIQNVTGTAEREFDALSDVTAGAGANAAVPTRILKVKGGGAVVTSSRESRVRRFHFGVPSAIAGQPSQDVFSPENIGDRVSFSEVTQKDDAFDATRNVYAGYLMADITRLDPLRFIGGARYEIATLDLTLGNALGVDPSVIQRLHRRDRALLPALSAVYALSDRSNLRAAYGATVARPHLRELSPTQFFDYVRSRVVSGDPKLAQTMIQNADLRWEMFLSASEVIAASVFYKYFDKPIERTMVVAGSGQNLSFANPSSATAYGVEVEARLTGGRLGPRFAPFYLGANFSAINSAVAIDRTDGLTRPLQGQSRYVTNVELGLRKNATQLSLLYNVFGRRIAEVGGAAGLLDVYEEPFHKVDLAFSQRLGRGLAVKLSAVNLLDSRTRFTQSGVEIYGFRPGVAAFATLEWAAESAKN